MPKATLLAGVALSIALGGCALKSDVRRVETEVVMLRQETARRDSVRAARLTEIITLQQELMDSLGTAVTQTQRTVRAMQGTVSNDLYNVQQQLVQLQELSGQSQQRLSELRAQVEARGQEVARDTAAAVAGPVQASAEQMYQASLQQLRRGSLTTARLGFRQLVQAYPTSPRVPDALYFIGESFSADQPDSAVVYYQNVIGSHPGSARVAPSLFKLGLLAEQRGDRAQARTYFQRVVAEFPRSDEAALARDKLSASGQ
jgi:tol-pal system protein YbgF